MASTEFESNRKCLLSSIASTLSGPSTLLKRAFHDVANDGCCEGPVFRIMQWNVLAQALSGGADNFVKCPVEAFDFERRKLHILEEILTYNADIVCLQEVDMFAYLEDALSSAGYTGTFFPKCDSPCLCHHPNMGPDGCAIFHKPDKLFSTKVYATALSHPRNSNMAFNHVALFQGFRFVDTKPQATEFMVATTHLKAKRGFEKLRGIETESLLLNLEEQRPLGPAIACGDFNGDPTEPFYDVCIDSDLHLGSAYTHLTEGGSEPPFTTIKIRGGSTTKETSRTIDYIWYTKTNLNVVKLLKFPTLDEIGIDRLPSLRYPSDHLSLVADFIVNRP